MGVRHFVRSYPSHAQSSKFEPCSLSKLTYLSLQALSLHTLFEHQIHHFFLISLSLLSPSSLLILSSHLFARLGRAARARRASRWALPSWQGRAVHGALRLCPAMPLQREVVEGDRVKGNWGCRTAPPALLLFSNQRRQEWAHTSRVARGGATRGGGRQRGAERGCALRRGSALTHELLHSGRAWRHDSSRSAQR
jgi:hypothetical protein